MCEVWGLDGLTQCHQTQVCTYGTTVVVYLDRWTIFPLVFTHEELDFLNFMYKKKERAMLQCDIMCLHLVFGFTNGYAQNQYVRFHNMFTHNIIMSNIL